MNFGTVYKIRLPPAIVAQPQGLVATAGQDITLTVSANGTQPLAYQWLLDGTALPGATNASLLLTSVQSANNGKYSVSVSNDLGTATSADATLRVNHLPAADAGATPTLVLSANGTNAAVVLDGSRSSDVDGDPLQYLWFGTGSGSPLAAGVVAIVALPVGTNSITLMVSDGLATVTNALIVSVLTASQGVQRLIALVEGSTIRHPQPLMAILSAAAASIQRQHPQIAVMELRAFQHLVRDDVSRHDAVLAATLIEAAQQVIEALGGKHGHPGGSPHCPIRWMDRRGDGCIALHFAGEPGQTHIVEATTNLVTWETIGVAVDNGDGSFEFQDNGAAGAATRFYRIISP
jgi:hypothetical protein